MEKTWRVLSPGFEHLNCDVLWEFFPCLSIPKHLESDWFRKSWLDLHNVSTLTVHFISYTCSFMQSSNQPITWRLHSTQTPADTRQQLQLIFTTNIRLKRKSLCSCGYWCQMGLSRMVRKTKKILLMMMWIMMMVMMWMRCNTNSSVWFPAACTELQDLFIKAVAEIRPGSSSEVQSYEKPPEYEAPLSFAASKSRAVAFASAHRAGGAALWVGLMTRWVCGWATRVK